MSSNKNEIKKMKMGIKDLVDDAGGIPGHYSFTETTTPIGPVLPRSNKEVDERTEVWLEQLQSTWERNEKDLTKCYNKSKGIRSSQICALVRMLVERGILE